jgi:predicted molibdopterin-dependent oxidoreductase YjgC
MAKQERKVIFGMSFEEAIAHAQESGGRVEVSTQVGDTGVQFKVTVYSDNKEIYKYSHILRSKGESQQVELKIDRREVSNPSYPRQAVALNDNKPDMRSILYGDRERKQ